MNKLKFHVAHPLLSGLILILGFVLMLTSSWVPIIHSFLNWLVWTVILGLIFIGILILKDNKPSKI